MPARCADDLHWQPLVSEDISQMRQLPVWQCILGLECRRMSPCGVACRCRCWLLRRGFHAQIRMWVNADNPAQSDAIVVFTNVSPAIPPGPQGCAVATPANRSALQLDPKACSSSGDGADMSTVVVQRLASIWNMTAAA